ncbi:MAG: peptidase C13 [Deltaproteobacteria bacterium]|nr:peptidase C13 [Deltaproteobacteria bacterium]
MRAILGNWANAFRFLLFRAVPVDCISVAGWQVAAFGLASLLVAFCWDFHGMGIEGQFSWEALPSALFPMSLMLIASITAAYALGNGDKMLLLLQVFLMVAAAIDLLVYVIYLAVAYKPDAQRVLSVVGYGNYLAPNAWLTLACAKAAADLLSVPVPRRGVAYIVCGIFLFLPLNGTYRQRGLWQEVEDHKELATPAASSRLAEEVFYDQPKILERQLAAVKVGRRGVVDIYFVGVGGYAYQDVFMKEIDAVSRLFRQRFGTAGKSISLINNHKTLADTPLASVTSLRASLQRVAEVMDNDEDLLFLFMTSHGSQTHRFSLDLRPLRFLELDPMRLRALLDESGIKNRVIVISACYSGGFIDPLRNENTLVISASAPDKNSFGCSNEAEWTHFGKAYFDESLRKTASFVNAFEDAKSIIAEREKEAGHIPSDPQIALGESIKPKLLQLQQELAVAR